MVNEQIIKEHEGLKLKPYKCTEGKLTIGYGHNLDANGISKNVAEFIFHEDLEVAIEAARDLFPTFDSLSPNRQTVLADMAFQLGKDGLAKFVGLRAAVAQNDWPRAAEGLLNSKLSKQTPNRVKQNVDLLIKG